MYSEDFLHWIEEFVFYEIRRITRTANLLLSVRRGCLCSKRCLLWVIQIGFTSHGDRIYTPIGIISISRRWRLFHRKGLSLSPIVGGATHLSGRLSRYNISKSAFRSRAWKGHYLASILRQAQQPQAQQPCPFHSLLLLLFVTDDTDDRWVIRFLTRVRRNFWRLESSCVHAHVYSGPICHLYHPSRRRGSKMYEIYLFHELSI